MRLLILASVLAVGFCMPGGYTFQDKTDPKYVAKLMDLSNQIPEVFTNGQPELISVQTQVVAGMNYNFTIRLGNQSWTNTEKVTGNTCKPTKRQFGLAGGYADQDAKDPMYMEMLTNLTMMNLIALPTNGYDLVGVRTQVVAGINYEFTLQINNKQCVIVYYERAWENVHQITNNTCKSLTGKRQLLGGFQPVRDMKDPGFQSCLSATLDGINARSNSMMRLVETSVTDAKQQIVAGTNYKFRVTVGESSCRNNEAKFGLTASGCPVNQNAQPMGSWDSHCYVGLDGKPQVNLAKTDVDVTKSDNNLLGGDTHDKVVHGKDLIGTSFHDLVQNGKQLLHDNGYDVVQRGKQLLGSKKAQDTSINILKSALEDGINLKAKAKELIGGDNHDFVQHGLRNLIGQDGHDYKPHGNSASLPDDIGSCKSLFMEFKKNYNKLYGSQEEEFTRLKIFCNNMERAKKFQQIERGTARYGPTKFADLTKSEFKKYVGKKWDQSAIQGMKKAEIPTGHIPESFDWREHGAVTEVKNQGSCGSCWAFSTTGNIEGQWAIKKKKLVPLSEQELVDCDKVDEGCNGGLPTQAYKEIERLGGLETEKKYPYEGEDEKCEFRKRDIKVYINDSVSISSNETEMAQWLAANGPISIGINAFAMQFYMGGVSHPWSIFCDPSELDHGVLIVGYGVEGDKPYWIVKNSWGADWGEKGYYLVYRGAGVCGLNTMCTSSVVY